MEERIESKPAPEHTPEHIVVNEEGEPLEGVTVFWEDDRGDQNIETDAHGNFRLIADGTYLEFVLEGYAQGRGWSSEGRYVLARERTLRVRVVDADGRGLAGIGLVVSLAESKYYVIDSDREFESGPDGLIVLDSLPPCRVLFRLDEENEHWILEGDETRALSSSGEVQIVLHPVSRLRGRVVDTNGTPVAGATIYSAPDAWIENTGWGGEMTLHGALATTDESGQFELTGREGRSISIFVELHGRRSATAAAQIPVGAGRVRHDMVLPDQSTHRSWIRLHIVGTDSLPIAKGVETTWSQVAFLPAGTVRNADGTAALRRMRYMPGTMAQAVFGGHLDGKDVGHDGGIDYELPLPPGTEIEFHIGSEDDHLPAHVVATSSADENSAAIEVKLTRGVRRRVRPPGLEIAGPCRVDASDDSDEYSVYLVDPSARYRVFDNSLDASTLIENEWRPPAGDVLTTFRWQRPEFREWEAVPRCALVVRDTAGRPIAGADCVMLDPEYPLGNEFGGAISDSRGVARLFLSADTPYRISARGHGTVVVSYPADEVRLSPAARLRVKMDLPGRWRLADWRLDIEAEGWRWPHTYRAWMASVSTVEWASAFWTTYFEEMWRPDTELTLPSGATGILDDLPPGPCRVRLWTAGYEEVVHVTLVSGQTATAVFSGTSRRR